MKQSEPGLFGQNHNNSSRDYTQEYYWGKNQFNSSFPASLVAYMSSKGISPVYLCTDNANNVVHKKISGAKLFRIDPCKTQMVCNGKRLYHYQNQQIGKKPSKYSNNPVTVLLKLY